MSKQAEFVFNNWKKGQPTEGVSLWSDGEKIYSYQTILVDRTKQGVVCLNSTKYSPTTTRHQNALEALLRANTVIALKRTADEMPNGSELK